MISRNDSWHWKISTGRHFQNGRHNTAKIQHSPISSKFDMWVDNDVPNWFLTLKNFKIFKMSAIFKMTTKTRHKKWVVKIQHCPISSKFDMWVDNDVPNWFLTLNNSYRSPFSNGHHKTAKIQHCPISSKFDMWVDYDVPNLLPTLKNI